MPANLLHNKGQIVNDWPPHGQQGDNKLPRICRDIRCNNRYWKTTTRRNAHNKLWKHEHVPNTHLVRTQNINTTISDETTCAYPTHFSHEHKATCLLNRHVSNHRSSVTINNRYSKIDSKVFQALINSKETADADGSKAKALTESQRKCVARTSVCCCIVSRDPGIMLPHLKRMASPLEILRLQGFADEAVKIPPGMTDLQFGSLVGNAFNCQVVQRLLSELLPLLKKG